MPDDYVRTQGQEKKERLEAFIAAFLGPAGKLPRDVVVMRAPLSDTLVDGGHAYGADERALATELAARIIAISEEMDFAENPPAGALPPPPPP